MRHKIKILGAESLGVRSLCCVIDTADRRVVIDPGIALGARRHGQPPHPLQVAVGVRIRKRIIKALSKATDIVFSHFHGDHIPLRDANPYQLSFDQLPSNFQDLSAWSKSPDDLPLSQQYRYQDLSDLMHGNMRVAEGKSDGPLSFSAQVPHGERGSPLGNVVMTRIEIDGEVFVHASDIQLLNEAAIDQILRWNPQIVLAAGPPLYLDVLTQSQKQNAWNNAVRLAQSVEYLILDHHLMRDQSGERWLVDLSMKAGKRVYCAADFMEVPRLMLEAQRRELYAKIPIPQNWHEDYAQGIPSALDFLASMVQLLESGRFSDES